MNVFIEGPNGSGKSTLADYIKNLLRWDQLNLGHRDGDQFRRYLAEYGRRDTVYVRAHWSEAVYSELFKRADPFTQREYRCLDDAAKLRGVTVLCLPPTSEVLKQRYLARVGQGLGAAMVEKYEQLEQEYALWYVTRVRGTDDVIYESRDHEDMVATAAKIVALVKARRGAQ